MDVDLNTIEYWSLAELFENAEFYKCSIPSELEGDFDSYRRKNAPTRTNPYIIQPFLRRKSWMLLTGEEGSGKSYMAMALGTAIATGGKLFLDWQIRQRKATVLYIVDEEMTQEIIHERMQILKKLYKGCENNFIIEQVKRLNLLENGKEFIEKLLYKKSLEGKCVEVLILDHLLELSNMHGDEEDNWPFIRELIEDLTEQGIAVILLHHEYAGKRMLGTRLIAADAPARVHLDAVGSADEDKINFNVSIIKNRGGKLDKQTKLVTLQLGKHPKWLLADKSIETGQYKFKEIDRKKRIELVKQYRTENLTNEQIAEKLDCSLSSIEKVIKDFPDDLKRKITHV